MIGIYIWEVYWGRAGVIRGVFIADAKSVADLEGKEVYLGEVLGKHSEVYGVIGDGMPLPTLLTDDPTDVASVRRIFKFKAHASTLFGYNPLTHLEDA